MTDTTDTSQPEHQHYNQALAYKMDDMSSYRDGFKNLMRLVKVMSVLIVLLTALDLYYIRSFVPQDSYFAVSPGGTKRRLVALPMPNAGRDMLSRWAAAAATQIMTFGFNNIDERMAASEKLFSPEGWQNFTAALFRSKMLRMVLNNQQMITAIPASAPIVLAEGMVAPGKYGWIMDAPMIATTRAGSAQHVQRFRARMIVVRLPTASNPMGLGINTFLLE